MDGDVVRVANELLRKAGRSIKLSRAEQCDCDLVYSLYEVLFSGHVVPRPNDDSVTYQLIIDGLSEVLPPEVSLDHIKGSAIAAGDLLSLHNLLQILLELFNVKKNESSSSERSLLHNTTSLLLTTTTGSSSQCTDDLLQGSTLTDDFLQVTAISQRVAIAKKELSSSSGSRDHVMRTPSPPRRHSSSFNPLLMSTPHRPAHSRLAEGMATDAETISSINSEITMTTSEVPSLTITTISTTEESHDTTEESHDATEESHDATITPTLETNLRGPPVLVPGPPETGRDMSRSPDHMLESPYLTVPGSPDARRDVIESSETESFDESSYSDSSYDPTDSSHDPTGSSHDPTDRPHDPADRAAILDTIYQHYIKDTKGIHNSGNIKGTRGTRKKVKWKQPASQPRPTPSSAYQPHTLAAGSDIMGVMMGEFPFLKLSPNMARYLWKKQLQQVKQLTRPLNNSNPAKQVQQAEERQQALLGIIKKELIHQRRMEELHQQQLEGRTVKARIHAHKMATVRTKRYYKDYELRLKAKMQRKRTREEQVFRKALEEGLELQRNRIRELQRFAKDKRLEEAKKHAEQMESMENYYRDQFMLLAEEIANEKAEKEIRGRAQQQLVDRMRRELRHKMEQEVVALQECIDREDDVVHFRQLDADNFLSTKLRGLTMATNT
ncbi:centrosomal protein of 95 kDa-like isoform X2 [Dysidea avara]|uniref:centrosomal protein of 95 kDa-like isoform X2 n=1 Tax=Dysidea avara TaxID=196820 RepID=UPI00332E0B41